MDVTEFGQQVQLSFDEFQLDSDDCSQDYVSVLNGQFPTSPEIGRFCGSTKPATIRSQSPHLWIRMHSDGTAGSGRGFSANVDAVSSGCGGIMHGSRGTFVSPNYPSPYGSDAECQWEIRADPGYRVVAWFSDRFDLENTTNCQNDFVELLDGAGESWSSLGRFCGKRVPPSVTSSAENLRVVFRSSSAVNGDGFRVSYILYII